MVLAFQDLFKLNRVYDPRDIEKVLEIASSNFKPSWSNKKVTYINIPCAFDIETSSFFRLTGNEQEKCAIMYEWTFGVCGLVIIGRTWNEFIDMMILISNKLKLTENKRLIVYVHNLAYEFQFIRKWFTWTKVFSVANRKPIYGVTTLGIEFRCSYLLSGYSLAKLGDQLQKYKVLKMVGDLDYSLIRHSKTPLTEKEIKYCVNDVKVVMAYIQEKIESEGGIAKIPLTKTGYARKYCKNCCFYGMGVKKDSYKRLRYLEIMEALTLGVDEYKQLKEGFQGGFTHSNPFYTGKVVENVTSYDFTSSYPTVMIAEKFPMSSGENITIKDRDDFLKNIKYYCCLFDVEIEGLKSKVFYDSYISSSRCKLLKGAVINNGRVVSAKHLITTITEQDYIIIKNFYSWDSLKVGNFIRYKKDYLPSDFVLSILNLYKAKTTLKNVDGKEAEYLNGKETLNSAYGMCVTDIARIEYIYDGKWEEPKTPNYEEAIEKYNKSKSRFLYYPWGVWVTAYARRNLFTGIMEFGSDYIYSDTDSIKVINAESHINYIENYNKTIRSQLIKAMDYHGFPHELIEPKTIKGIAKCLGVWDFDGSYQYFKTLGAKRYLVKYSNDVRNGGMCGKINLTVSGLNKQVCVPYLIEKYGDDVFTAFNDELTIPKDRTGKMTHTYIDDERHGIVTDYLGAVDEYHELSCVHLEEAEYSLSISKEYIDYYTGLQTDYV